MKGLFALIATVALALGLAGTAMGADDLAHTGRVVFVTGGDVEIAADEQADAVIVIGGDARVEGTVNALVVVDGTATVAGATLDTIAVAGGTLNLEAGTVVRDDVLEFDATTLRADGVEIGGTIKDMAADVAAFGVFIGLAALALWIGFGIATLLVGLLLAAVAARQVRTATDLITRQPGTTFLVGLLSIVIPPIVAGLAMVTIIGIPAGLGLLLLVWPTVAFIGYIVAAIWLGEWLLGRRDGAVPAERPYAAATLGLLVAFVVGLVPLASAVLSIFGLGAVVSAAWRTIRRGGAPQPAVQIQPAAA